MLEQYARNGPGRQEHQGPDRSRTAEKRFAVEDQEGDRQIHRRPDRQNRAEQRDQQNQPPVAQDGRLRGIAAVPVPARRTGCARQARRAGTCPTTSSIIDEPFFVYYQSQLVENLNRFRVNKNFPQASRSRG
ncbi:MAG: hypothetical protein ACLTZY_14420 [Alistipes indistinctus]